MPTPVMVIFAVTVSRLLFATIEDEVHEDDLRRGRPLKVVVLFDGAVNW